MGNQIVLRDCGFPEMAWGLADFDPPVRVFGEPMQLGGRSVMMREDQAVGRNLEMGETVNVLPEGNGSLRLLQLPGIRSAPTGQNERSGKSLKFEVLEVVIVAAEIRMDTMLLEQIPPASLVETAGVAVIAVGIDGMVGLSPG